MRAATRRICSRWTRRCGRRVSGEPRARSGPRSPTRRRPRGARSGGRRAPRSSRPRETSASRATTARTPLHRFVRVARRGRARRVDESPHAVCPAAALVEFAKRAGRRGRPRGSRSSRCPRTSRTPSACAAHRAVGLIACYRAVCSIAFSTYVTERALVWGRRCCCSLCRNAFSTYAIVHDVVSITAWRSARFHAIDGDDFAHRH